MENKKKALITTTTPYMIKQFLMNDISILKELGYEIEIGTNWKTFNVISEDSLKKFRDQLLSENIKINQIDFSRNIFDISSIFKSYRQVKELLNNSKYKIVHTHTPVAGLITRLANRKCKNYVDTKMIYTAHGFHFFKGNNPIKNFIFRNIEKLGAKYTDTLITINKEDYEAAKKFKLKKKGTVEYVPGVGIDIEKIDSIKGSKEELCKELNIPFDSTLLLSVGELNENKNHKVVIETLPDLPKDVHYIICGTGNLHDSHISLAKELKVEDRLHLLGYRNDVIKVMKSCDIFVFPSKREGLSVALMEAMACGLACIASNIRGNVDLIKNGEGGYLIERNDSIGFIQNIDYLINNIEIIKKSANYNQDKIKKYSIENVIKQYKYIYQECPEKNFERNKK